MSFPESKMPDRVGIDCTSHIRFLRGCGEQLLLYLKSRISILYLLSILRRSAYVHNIGVSRTRESYALTTDFRVEVYFYHCTSYTHQTTWQSRVCLEPESVSREVNRKRNGSGYTSSWYETVSQMTLRKSLSLTLARLLAILAMSDLDPYAHLGHLGRPHVPETQRRRTEIPASARCQQGEAANSPERYQGENGTEYSSSNLHSGRYHGRQTARQSDALRSRGLDAGGDEREHFKSSGQ